MQRVRTGGRSAGQVTILSGLQPGQQIAAKNAFLLKGELEKEEAGHGH
jgi:cobalt-zinc-cadmium efflux system membrane fusion protein